MIPHVRPALATFETALANLGPLQRITLMLLTVIALPCLTILQAANFNPQRQREQRADQLVSRSVPICDALTHSAPELQYAVDEYGTGVLAGWSVDCINASGRQVAYLDWDPLTGQLRRVSYDPVERNPRYTTPSTAAVAVRAALTWARLLEPSARWQAVGVPVHGYHVWLVRCRSERRHLVIQLRDSSLDLLMAQLRSPGTPEETP